MQGCLNYKIIIFLFNILKFVYTLIFKCNIIGLLFLFLIIKIFNYKYKNFIYNKIYSSIKKIPFFKYFYIKKIFNVKFINEMRIIENQ
jgi:hypothetical protein